jgi:hypothetical protein
VHSVKIGLNPINWRLYALLKAFGCCIISDSYRHGDTSILISTTNQLMNECISDTCGQLVG